MLAVLLFDFNVHVCRPCVLRWSWRLVRGKGVGFFGTGETGGFELLMWEPGTGGSSRRTAKAEPSLQPVCSVLSGF